MTNIVVGVDGSDSAAAALRWAAREAQLHRRTVVAVLAWGLLDQHRTDSTAPFDPHYSERQAREALDAYVAAALGSCSARVVRQVVCDLAAPALLDAARDASLLVVGARGLGGFRGLLLGSVSTHCLHHATVPVAVIRHDGATPTEGATERIVVGIDGSETARRALQWALTEGRLRGAVVDAVHAWQVPYVGGLPYPSTVLEPTLFEEDARRTLTGALTDSDTTGLPEPVEPTLVAGGAATAILEAAKDADLVVVGSRGQGGFRGLLLGSVSHQVARHATSPVVVVPPGT